MSRWLNLGGIARARLEKPPRAYQTDAEIHTEYTKTVYGGGEDGADMDGDDDDQLPVPGVGAMDAMFQPMGAWDECTFNDIVEFKTRTRLNVTTKELLELPCMQRDACEDLTAGSTIVRSVELKRCLEHLGRSVL